MSTRLTPAEAAAHARAAFQNALDLLHDARLLYEAGRHARAVALFILAIEETSKPAILAAIAASDDDSEREKLWKQMRSHQAKNLAGALPFAVLKLAKELGKTSPSDEALAAAWTDGPKTLDLLKQQALYVSQNGEGTCSIPNKIIRLDVAMPLSEISASCVSAAQQSPLLLDAGMALYVKILGQALRDGTSLRMAWAAYREAVIQSGLVPEGWADPGYEVFTD